MTTLIVLFNLEDPGRIAEYERWAREVDVPTAGALPSVDHFEVLKSTGLLGGGVAPYQYIEILRINDLAQLGKDAATPAMQAITEQFKSFADNPLFIVTDSIG